MGIAIQSNKTIEELAEDIYTSLDRVSFSGKMITFSSLSNRQDPTTNLGTTRISEIGYDGMEGVIECIDMNYPHPCNRRIRNEIEEALGFKPSHLIEVCGLPRFSNDRDFLERIARFLAISIKPIGIQFGGAGQYYKLIT